MNRKILLRFLKVFLPLLILIAASVVFTIWKNRSVMYSYVRIHDQGAVNISAERANTFFENMVSDMTYLSGKKRVLESFKNPDARVKKNLEFDFILFENSKRIYDQIRLLDTAGAELVRVNYRNGNPMAVPDSQLQRNGQRRYFSESRNLTPGSVYISRIDLNKEPGKIETPWKPVIRMIAPVFEGNKKLGYVVTNYLANDLLQKIARIDNTQAVNRLFVLNHEGYFLYGVSQDSLFGFESEGKQDLNFENIHPEIWSSLIHSKDTQQEFGDLLITHTTLNPYRNYQSLRDEPIQPYNSEVGDLYVLTISSRKAIHSLTANQDNLIILLAAAITLIIAFIVWVLVRSKVLDEAVREAVHEKELLLLRQLKAIDRSLIMVELDMNFNITWANHNYLETVEHKMENVINRPHSRFMDPDFVDSDTYRNMTEQLNRGEFVGVEIPFTTPSGRRLWRYAMFNPILDAKGKPVRILKLSVDITHQKLLEQENIEQLETISSLALVSMTDRDGIIIYANDNFCKLSGYSRDELIGQNHRMLKSGKQPDGLFVGMWQAITMGRTWRGEICNKNKNGGYYWVDTAIRPIMGVDGKPDKYLSIRFDITGQKEYQKNIEFQAEELRKSQESLNKTNEELQISYFDLARSKDELTVLNKELESFSYSVSHDLRAPLRAIGGFADLVRTKYAEALNPDALRYIGIIRDNVRKMGELIDDLLAFSRMSRTTMSKFQCSMDDLVHTVLNEMKQIQFNCSFVEVDPLGMCYCDKNMMKQVWTNLIGNALKYSSKKEQPKIQIGRTEINGQSTYFIKDNGVGFDMKYSSKLFEVFQRLHGLDEFEGTGIGLAIVFRIISRHGGTIWAESEVGAGACFYFRLPDTVFDAVNQKEFQKSESKE